MGIFSGFKNLARGFGFLSPETPDYSDAYSFLDKAPEYKSAGELLSSDYIAGPSAIEGVSTDPKLKAAQMAALAKLQEYGEGGLTLSDKADLQAIADQEMAQERGQREALTQNFQRRGQAGSGFELANQMLNQQESANRASQRDTNIAAQAQARAYQALMDSGTLGGNMRNQEYGENMDKARAKDMINMFNLTNRQGIDQYNLGERQRISDANTTGGRNVAFTKAGYGKENAENQANAQNKQGDVLRNTVGQGLDFWGELKKKAPVPGV